LEGFPWHVVNGWKARPALSPGLPRESGEASAELFAQEGGLVIIADIQEQQGPAVAGSITARMLP